MNGCNKEFWVDDRTTIEGRALKSMFDTLLFDELIHEPTHIANNSLPCIDHIYTNNNSNISQIGVRTKIASDLCTIFVILKYITNKPKCYKKKGWNYDKGDYDKFQNLLLDAPWHECYNMYNCNFFNDVTDKWMNIFFSIATKCIPYYEITVRPEDKDFMNFEIRSLMRVRDHVWNQHNVSGDQVFSKISSLLNEIKFTVILKLPQRNDGLHTK